MAGRWRWRPVPDVAVSPMLRDGNRDSIGRVKKLLLIVLSRYSVYDVKNNPITNSVMGLFLV